ncbi:MAG: antibiotic biosynthesis monooxygenase [Pseudomonadota bacterium]|nr:antibiotic biosynthesis monooxygenase [Pseudomonadota bacterium]
MKPYVVMVDFLLKPGAKETFRALIDVNAQASCRDEPGCRRFDVLEASADADRIVLYEIYDDQAAFRAHIETRHFAVFDRESKPLVAEKRVSEYALVCEGSGRLN